jgi:hypothetical protein
MDMRHQLFDSMGKIQCRLYSLVFNFPQFLCSYFKNLSPYEFLGYYLFNSYIEEYLEV